MKLHVVALLASALLFGGCAESVEEIQVSNPAGDGGGDGGTDSSTAKDSSTTPPDTNTDPPDTEPEDTGSVDDSGEFPDFGGGDDGGGTIDPDSGGAADGGGSGGTCTKTEDCPGGCCDTTAGKCGVEIIPGVCFAI